MGFGFNLIVVYFFFLFLLFLLVLFLLSVFTKKRVYLTILKVIVLGISSIVLLSFFMHWVTSKTVLDHDDYHGSYVIDRDYFSGPETDWQYNSFRFEILENDSIYFYVTDHHRIIKTYKGTISTTSSYESKRLKLHMQDPVHHVLSQNPTTYRSPWSFYLVLCSPEYNNMYFRKGKWKELD